MQLSIGQKTVVGAFIVLGAAAVVFSVMIFIVGIVDGWLFSNVFETILVSLLLVFMAGPFVAIVGVYAWRRADSERRSTKNARVMIVVGTLGIAGVAGTMYWTIIGPIIAIGIVAYWVHKIRGWRGGAPRSA